MATHEDMDEFVNWDHQPSSTAFNGALDPSIQQPLGNDPNMSMDLALENAFDDDFSFHALQYFSGEPAFPNVAEADLTLGALSSNCFETPLVPCSNCTAAGYQCKIIREGKHQGYCTCCVALSCECSLASSYRDDPVEQLPSPSEQECLDLLAGINTSPGLVPLQPTFIPEQLPMAAPQPIKPSASQSAAPPVGKIGARLSRESIRILRHWLSTHQRHPYPSDEEKDMLQRQTGLTKTQITNWLANARRRGKIQPPRSTSPHPGRASIDIPVRRATPSLESMNPLQRWVDSPPENEPASAIAIARAVTASTVSSSQASPFSHIYTDDGSGRSIHESSASSVGTSHSSGGSFASAYSHGSRTSFGSFNSFNRGRRRRRRRSAPKRAAESAGLAKTALTTPPRTYQCTFCTDSFKTKHDWQRHEKSLHLSLERWICSNHGPRAPKAGISKAACVFCGEPDPSDEHIESHNYSACQEKPVEGRTFYRKDHLDQHLRLVHGVKFADWAMKDWKLAMPEIRSRCGFCGITMDTWTIRVDHLAEHFKMGSSMEHWKGGWGFDSPVLSQVEKSIPPYLIHNERNSPLPYTADESPPESPRNAYELIKVELDYFLGKVAKDATPSDDDLQIEACRIIFASEVLSVQGIASMVSWLRDLVMSSEPLAQQAQFGPLRSRAENRLAVLKINGKDNLFEACPLENDLHEFVRAKRLLGLTAMDDELQEEACRIVGRMEEVSTHPSERVANWLIRRIKSSTDWLASFRGRAHLPRTEDMTDTRLRPTNPTKIDSTIHNYSRLERELGEYVDFQRSLGVEPTDEDLQREARIIIYEIEDGWNQTAADNGVWLAAFRQRHNQGSPARGVAALPVTMDESSDSSGSAGMGSESAVSVLQHSVTPNAGPSPGPSGCRVSLTTPGSSSVIRGGALFLNDANCYRRLASELSRWVASVMSPNNPNQHVPTDEELQHQSRWILYDDDDPWNQTAADNAEWLQRFKRQVGLLNQGPGLPIDGPWAVHQGGSGFAPPYAFPRDNAPPPSFDDPLQVYIDGRAYQAAPTTASRFLETMGERYPKPARVFCSRELEEGLADMVRQETGRGGAFPSDEALRKRAREILYTHNTAADDPILLGKFKTMMEEELGVGTAATTAGPVGAVGGGVGEMAAGMDATLSGADMSSMLLQDMNFDFVFDTQDMAMLGSGASS